MPATAFWRIVRPLSHPRFGAGARFVQTQAVYDVARFAGAMSRAVDMGLTERVAVLPGIIVPRSARMLEYMNGNVAGIEVPESMIARLKGAKKPKAEGLDIAVELIQALREIPGIKGIHLQAIEGEGLLPKVLGRAGLLPRPAVVS